MTHPDQDLHSTTESPNTAPMTRRGFLKRMSALGGGILFYYTLGPAELLARTERTGYIGSGIPVDFNAFLRIGADNRVTCYTGKIEMGQGPITSLPQMLAEELDVTYENVDIVMGDTDLCPWDAGTWGSLTTRYFGIFLREAACEARGVLKEMAAEQLKVPADRLDTADGAVFDPKNPGRKVSYAELTGGKVIERHLKELPPLQPVSEFTVMGRSFDRRDGEEKVTGKAEYAADIRFPELLYAKLLRPPAHGARLKTVDTSAAEKMDGVRVVREGDFVAVLHERPDRADQALSKINAEFDPPPEGVDDESIFDHLVKKAPSPNIVSSGGNLETGKKSSAEVLEETYLNSYVAHAPMEPHAATAQLKDGKMTVWASTQAPFPLRDQIARTVNLSPDRVRVITPFVGGGFGGKSASQQAVEAARAKTRNDILWIAEMVPIPQLIALYSHASLFVCPSVYEPFGIINLEAMACHTPVVAAAVGGIPEVVVHGETGLQVPFEPTGNGSSEPENPDAYSRDLAAAVNTLMTSPDRRKEMGEASRRRVEAMFSWKSIAEQTQAYYRKLVSAK